MSELEKFKQDENIIKESNSPQGGPGVIRMVRGQIGRRGSPTDIGDLQGPPNPEIVPDDSSGSGSEVEDKESSE